MHHLSFGLSKLIKKIPNGGAIKVVSPCKKNKIISKHQMGEGRSILQSFNWIPLLIIAFFFYELVKEIDVENQKVGG